MFLIDTHCHLNMEQFAEDIENVIRNALSNNVKYLQTICTKLTEYEEIISIIEKYENVYGSVGVHPIDISNETTPTAEQLIQLAQHPKIISFGETGLDYYYPNQDLAAQKKSFINHISASQQTSLPLIIHTRDAEEDTISILQSEMRNSHFSAIVHCFTGSYNLAKAAIDLGLYISVAGIVTFKNATTLQDTISKLPLDRLLVETDAPYLAPVPMRGKRNEPAFTKYTAEYIAALHNISVDEVTKITTQNAQKVFAKACFI